MVVLMVMVMMMMMLVMMLVNDVVLGAAKTTGQNAVRLEVGQNQRTCRRATAQFVP